MTLIQHFVEQLRKGYEDEPWHGPSTAALLDGLDAVQASSHVVPGAHSIWEIVLHMDAWQREITRRLKGSIPDQPIEGDWRAVVQIDNESWNKAKSALGESLNTVVSALKSSGDTVLDQQAGDTNSRVLGTGVSYAAMISGLIQHNAYHSGQIAVLRKAIETTGIE